MIRILLLFCGIATSLVWAEEVFIPPAPERPVVARPNGVSNDAKAEATKRETEAFTKWRADLKAWQESLTPEQKAELSRREERKRHEMQARMDRMQRLPTAQDGYAWEPAAKEWKLTPETIDRLRTDKFAYGRSVRQSFTPYLGGPVFITTDSALNAFHVLFETTFRDYEVRQSWALREALETLLKRTREQLAGVPAWQGDLVPAWRQVQLVVGPALVLLGGSAELLDAELRPEIDALVVKVRAASAQELPTWLTPATRRCPSLDYRLCKPLGLYAADPRLSDYFRAVRWMQIVPFRADRDVELTAIGLLTVGLKPYERTGPVAPFEAYATLVGPRLVYGLPEAAHHLQNFLSPGRAPSWAAALAERRRFLLVVEKSSRGSGALTVDDETRFKEIEYRLMPASRLPDSAVFQALADQQIEPEGLVVATLLGSDFARSRLAPASLKATESALALLASDVDAKRSVRSGTPTLYEDYLGVLRTLFVPLPAEAPAFLRREAWQAKSVQTALAGWAQMRHTFMLHAQKSEMVFGMTIAPPGFVEPNPEFFSRLADLVERSRGLFGERRDRWDALATVVRKLDALVEKQLRGAPWSVDDEKFLRSYGEKMGFVMGYDGNSYEMPLDDAPRWVDVHHTQATDRVLAVAVGRPRTLYVLYPWNGLEILCQGSVMPYYEYRTQTRLTDEEWKHLLDSPDAPHQPEWLVNASPAAK